VQLAVVSQVNIKVGVAVACVLNNGPGILKRTDIAITIVNIEIPGLRIDSKRAGIVNRGIPSNRVIAHAATTLYARREPYRRPAGFDRTGFPIHCPPLIPCNRA